MTTNWQAYNEALKRGGALEVWRDLEVIGQPCQQDGLALR